MLQMQIIMYNVGGARATVLQCTNPQHHKLLSIASGQVIIEDTIYYCKYNKTYYPIKP